MCVCVKVRLTYIPFHGCLLNVLIQGVSSSEETLKVVHTLKEKSESV